MTTAKQLAQLLDAEGVSVKDTVLRHGTQVLSFGPAKDGLA
ncbi:hypothetical protein [Nonomuraea dietziae]